MKQGIHPEYMVTKVKCNGCGTTFETRSTIPEITVEICSNCHPFYTGKQKLVDTAGRVDRFIARRKEAETRAAQKTSAKSTAKAKEVQKPQDTMDKIEGEFEEQTVDLKQRPNQSRAKKPKQATEE